MPAEKENTGSCSTPTSICEQLSASVNAEQGTAKHIISPDPCTRVNDSLLQNVQHNQKDTRMGDSALCTLIIRPPLGGKSKQNGVPRQLRPLTDSLDSYLLAASSVNLFRIQNFENWTTESKENHFQFNIWEGLKKQMKITGLDPPGPFRNVKFSETSPSFNTF